MKDMTSSSRGKYVLIRGGGQIEMGAAEPGSRTHHHISGNALCPVCTGGNLSAVPALGRSSGRLVLVFLLNPHSKPRDYHVSLIRVENLDCCKEERN
jgi:hypothetical protein